jgi:hypothetical protein
MSDDPDALENIIKYKIPFFALGVAVGMALVWIAFQWVPGV